MMSATTKLLTAEEFMQLPNPPDGSLQELVKGKVVTMPPPKPPHGSCCLKVAIRIGTFIEQHQLGRASCNDEGFIVERSPDSVRGPDFAFWHKDRWIEPPEGQYPTIVPDLVAQVVSSEDSHSRLQRKVVQYLKCGVKMIWLIDPDIRIVTVHRSLTKSAVLENGDTLSGEDVLPGFSCPVSELFA